MSFSYEGFELVIVNVTFFISKKTADGHEVVYNKLMDYVMCSFYLQNTNLINDWALCPNSTLI